MESPGFAMCAASDGMRGKLPQKTLLAITCGSGIRAGETTFRRSVLKSGNATPVNTFNSFARIRVRNDDGDIPKNRLRRLPEQFQDGRPIQAVFWLECGSSTADRVSLLLALHSNRTLCIIRRCKEYRGAQLRSARCCSSRPAQQE